MRILLIRHEERNLKDPRFFTPLTEKGRVGAMKLSNYLISFNIDFIFSSPFERAIQTILPYSINNDKKINIENSLYESTDNPIFIGEKTYSKTDINPVYNNFINHDYESQLNIDDLGFSKDGIIIESEKIIDLEKRTKYFLNYLMANNFENVLLISHESTLKYLEKTIHENYFEKKHEYSKFEMGEIREYKIDNKQ
jgi:broad specificity phosphatase PhoE